MVFSSPTFLFLFLPVIYLLNLIAPRKISNPLLLMASLLFYGWGEPVFVLLLIISAMFNYFSARLIDTARRAGQRRRQQAALTLAVCANIGLLLVFKYTDFLLGAFNSVFRLSIPMTGIPLPIGISFFTFQALSYVIDVYRQETGVQKNFVNLLFYISFFPQLIAGPIVKYHDVARQIENRSMSLPETAMGIRRFIIGLSKKMLIANTVGYAADRIFAFDPTRLDGALAWMGAITYAIQIYFDFSGYSDMAIGLGHLFGFTFKENFLHPYTATSMQDFWRRWHVSLSTWFKEYLYIPLGGNRISLWRTGLNRVIVFFLTGLWHGASWSFVVWGLYHGFFLMLETYGVIRPERFPLRILRRVYTLLVVMCGFVLFRAETLLQGSQVLRSMALGWHRLPDAQALLAEVATPGLIAALIVAVFASTDLVSALKRQVAVRPGLASFREPAGYAFSLMLLALCILAMSASTYNPFIYFRF